MDENAQPEIKEEGTGPVPGDLSPSENSYPEPSFPVAMHHEYRKGFEDAMEYVQRAQDERLAELRQIAKQGLEPDTNSTVWMMFQRRRSPYSPSKQVILDATWVRDEDEPNGWKLLLPDAEYYWHQFIYERFHLGSEESTNPKGMRGSLDEGFRMTMDTHRRIAERRKTIAALQEMGLAAQA